MTEERAIARRKRRTAKLVAGLTALMVAPPVIAGVLGSLGLAVVVGVLSIFAGLVGMSAVVSRWELVPRRAAVVALPKARVVEKP